VFRFVLGWQPLLRVRVPLQLQLHLPRLRQKQTMSNSPESVCKISCVVSEDRQNYSLAMAKTVFPEFGDAAFVLKKCIGRAEALLIAEEELAAFVYAATACRVFIRDGSRQYRHHIMTV
jgi:hypothetical protein